MQENRGVESFTFEDVHNVNVFTGLSDLEGRFPAVVDVVDGRGAFRQKKSDNSRVTSLAGDVQTRVSVLVQSVQGSTPLEQNPETMHFDL